MSTHLPNLDGLRALAILPVLGLHASYGLIQGGFLGVDLFFVLSGFLITRNLTSEIHATGRIDLRRFFLRRSLRLLPATVLALLLARACWSWTADGDDDFLVSARAVLLYHANFIDGARLGSLASTWSLSIEEQFYLVWPLALPLLHRLTGGRPGRLVTVLWLAVLLVAVWRAGRWMAHPGDLDLYRHTLARVDALMLGACASLVVLPPTLTQGRAPRLAAALVTGAFLVASLTCSATADGLYLGGFTAIALLAALLVRSLAELPPVRLFSHPLMAWVGRRSYGLYLYHLIVFEALEPLRVAGSAANLLLVTLLRLGLTFAVAELSWRWVERPMLAWKDRIPAQRSPPT